MRRYSVFVLLLLGIIVISAGSVELLREAGVVVLGLNVFGSVLIVTLGLWIVACAVECNNAFREESRKS